MVLFAPSAGDGSLPFPQADKVVHCTLFAVLAGTARWRYGPLTAALVAVAAYAPLSEVAQSLLLPHRDGDWRDAAVDLLGAAAGWLLATRLLRRPHDQAATAAR